MINSIILAALMTKMDPAILNSICKTETEYRNIITRFDGKTPSYGICQIKLKTAMWMRKKYKFTDAKLDVVDLMNPYTNAYYASLYLQYQFKKCKSWSKAVKAYNSGKCESNNNEYLAKVKSALELIDGPQTRYAQYNYHVSIPNHIW